MKTLPHRLLSGIKAYGADLYCNLESKFKITEGQLIHAISSARYCNLELLGEITDELVPEAG